MVLSLFTAGFNLVLDTTVSRELSLLETYKEFISRKQRYDSGDKTALPMLTGICPGKNPSLDHKYWWLMSFGRIETSLRYSTE